LEYPGPRGERAGLSLLLEAKCWEANPGRRLQLLL
jgi:hypothetical protein